MGTTKSPACLTIFVYVLRMVTLLVVRLPNTQECRLLPSDDERAVFGEDKSYAGIVRKVEMID